MTKREENLIYKGGDARIDKEASDIDYDPTLKKLTMARVDAGVPVINRTTNRKVAFGNMYKQEDDFTPDHYDSVKIAHDVLKTKQKVKPFVDMKKQTKRDFSKLWKGNDAYQNVLRENARQDYIKNLIDEV